MQPLLSRFSSTAERRYLAIYVIKLCGKVQCLAPWVTSRVLPKSLTSHCWCPDGAGGVGQGGGSSQGSGKGGKTQHCGFGDPHTEPVEEVLEDTTNSKKQRPSKEQKVWEISWDFTHHKFFPVISLKKAGIQ